MINEYSLLLMFSPAGWELLIFELLLQTLKDIEVAQISKLCSVAWDFLMKCAPCRGMQFNWNDTASHMVGPCKYSASCTAAVHGLMAFT